MTLPVQVAWKDTRFRLDAGSYTGDGATNGNVVALGFDPDFVIVQENASARTAIGMGSNSVGITPGLANDISDQTSIYPTTNGFVVGDGAVVANTNGTSYQYLAIQAG